jgi:hypothetical protein
MSTLQLMLLKERGESRVSQILLPGPFPATVRGSTRRGEEFEIQTTLDNFSSSHLFLELKSSIEVTDKLFIVTKIYQVRVAIRGRVLRVEQLSAERTRLEIEIRSYRFLQMEKAVEVVTG